MSRYKDYLMEWEDRINEIEGYEEKISESECLAETVDFVINKLKFVIMIWRHYTTSLVIISTAP